MPVRDVALDRDVRSARLLPVRASYGTPHFFRRTLGVIALLVIDLGALLLAVLAAAIVAGLSGFALWPGLTWAGLLIACAVLVLSEVLTGLYGRRHTRHNVGKLFTAWTIAFVVTSVILLGLSADALGARLVTVWLAAFAVALAGRWVFDAALDLKYGVEGECPQVLLLGHRNACLQALPTLAALPLESRVCVAGLVVPGGPEPGEAAEARGAAAGEAAATQSVPPVVAAPEDLRDALWRTGAAEVIIADPLSLNGQVRDVMRACRTGGVALKVVVADLQLDGRAVSYVPGLDCPFYVVSPRPAGWASYFTKRVLDRLTAAVLLILLSPLLLLIALLIKLTSRGPVFFAGERVGLGQRPFPLYKFRTMVPDAHQSQAALESCNEADGVLFKIRDDPRVTGFGRVLRRLSLDELPQLINVLRGDMSIVGPRPLPLRDCELMEEWHRQRHVVLPGITGLWQVSGRSDLAFADMVELDLRYIETWTLRSDLKILWRTAGSVLGARGAY
jgi:exopolysaccharide biosynthesis polyprenyl glycosylphosphotransferase